MFKIIIVEDDKEIREELKVLLENTNYEVKTITEFEDVEGQIVKEEAHLVLLDINLPHKNGYEICKKVRIQSKIPIIFVTNRNNSMDELNGIMIGGDDYVEKPYNVPILMARIQRVLDRVYAKERINAKIEYKNITLNALEATLSFQGKTIELTRNEIKIMYYLFTHHSQIVPRGDIVEYLWDNQMYIDDNTLSVNMTRIREKLAEIGIQEFIETKRGQGYKI